MPLKITYDRAEEIPAEHKNLYVERNGAWHLDTPGDFVPASRVEELQQENTRLQQAHERAVIGSEVITKASARGLRPTAQVDLVARAGQSLRLVEGRAVVVDPNGTVRKKKDDQPMTAEDWVEQVMGEAPHLFDTNTGGGATGNQAGTTGNTVNPYRKETWNITEQMKLERLDPVKAAALEAEASRH